MIKFKLDTSALRDAFRREMKDATVEIYSDGWVGHGGDPLLEVVEEQRKWGRDPWFLSRHVQKVVSEELLEGVILPMFARKPFSRRRVLESIGERVLKAVKANMRNGRNLHGRFRAVSSKRAAVKKNLRLDKRPMFAEGKLYESLRYRIS